MNTTFENTKIGDKVYDFIRQEWGTITAIHKPSDYPIQVFFKENDVDTYTNEGMWSKGYKQQTLFWDYVAPITAPDKPITLPDLKVDDKVIVWDIETKHNRYFSHFNDKGEICTFRNGCTSFSSATTEEGIPLTTTWPNYEIVEE